MSPRALDRALKNVKRVEVERLPPRESETEGHDSDVRGSGIGVQVHMNAQNLPQVANIAEQVRCVEFALMNF